MLTSDLAAVPSAPDRVWIIGLAGSGKSTVGANVSNRTGLRLVELDDLFWEPGWRKAPDDVFRKRVSEATAAARWVACGNYLSRLRDVLWDRADLLVWLDPPVSRVLLRLQMRTIRQARSGVEICSGNRNLYRHLWASDGPFRYTVKNWRNLRAEVIREAATPDPPVVLRLDSTAAVNRWLSTLGSSR